MTICESCPHRLVQKGHPSGNDEFCRYMAPNGPAAKPIAPIKCAGHPTEKPEQRNLASAKVQDVADTAYQPLHEDIEIDIGFRPRGMAGNGPGNYVFEVRNSEGQRVWFCSESKFAGPPCNPGEIRVKLTFNPDMKPDGGAI